MTTAANKERIAVVGAGIIGLYLAWQLQDKGFEVTVFEKRNRVGEKPCSSLISERIKKFIPVDNLYQRKISSVIVHFPRKSIELKVKPSFLLFERQKLDEFLFDLAKKEGVEIIVGKEINEIPQGFSKIIGCDGALSQVRKILSLPEPQFRLGIQAFVHRAGGDESEKVETWPKIKNGFFWKIPRIGEIEYGAIGPKDFLKQGFEEFCQEQGINLEPDKSKAAFDKNKSKAAFDKKAALVPQGICLPDSENITLCGDAAGLSKPTTGGGVIWGLYAANVLIKNFSDFRKYKKETERFFKPKILKGKLEVSLGYFLGKYFPYILPKNISIDADLF